MPNGTVKWFDETKCYGLKSLIEGDSVSFEVEQGEKGPKAVNVEKLS